MVSTTHHTRGGESVRNTIRGEGRSQHCKHQPSRLRSHPSHVVGSCEQRYRATRTFSGTLLWSKVQVSSSKGAVSPQPSLQGQGTTRPRHYKAKALQGQGTTRPRHYKAKALQVAKWGRTRSRAVSMDRTSSLAVTMMLAILGGSSRAALAFVAPCASGLISSSTSRSILASSSSSSRAAAADQAGGGGVRRFQRSVTARMAADGDAVSDDDFNADLSTKTAFLFPGQGAQYVGMASTICDEVPRAKEMFDTAKEILGYDLLDRCQNGPKELLDSTEVSQPAIFVCSMAAVEKLRMELGEDVIQSATCAVGLSLGEYSALCFAGAMSFEDGVKVTKARGEAMQAASDATDGGMVSVIGLDSDKVKELCVAASEQSGESVSLANFLCNGNYAVSGSKKACDVIEQIAKPDFGARMCVRLAVAGAFHTEFMAAAVEPLGKVLDEISIVKPRIPVLSNVDVLGHSDPKVIKENLKKQVTNPVRWEESMKLLLDNGFEKGFECGPGKVVAGIMKRIDRKALIEGVEV